MEKNKSATFEDFKTKKEEAESYTPPPPPTHDYTFSVEEVHRIHNVHFVLPSASCSPKSAMR